MKKVVEKIKSFFKKTEKVEIPVEVKSVVQESKPVSRKKSKEELENPKNKKIIDAIKKVMDPELGIDLWTLGLIYDITHENGNVHIVMTFTSIMCPLGPQMIENIKQEVRKVKGVRTVDVEVSFEPMWEPTEDLRSLLGV